ncbi:MAG TPA: NAD-dependent epimerase/dehydratase family protein [Thermoanaerobaculia bacterium]|nr:NAD-dependent epimerase/dehydratase family protein [Thermoanaerobaculia bacterium]
MKVLVTGGAGFIGSHIADAYLARGWRVTALDNLSTGDRRNLNARAEFVEADLRDPSTFARIAELEPDVVSHHAAQIDVRHSVADPAADAEVNVIASIRLLQTAHEIGVKRFLFASTGGAIYGEPLFAPQTEEHPRNPLSPYGCAKLSVEHYLHFYREIYGLKTVALRYGNVYGPRQNAKGEAGVIAIFADRLLDGHAVTINGSGEQTRDYVFVGDVVAANLAATDIEEGGAFNVGTGVETSVNDLYAMLAAELGTSLEAAHGPAKAGEQMRSVLDGSRLRERARLRAPAALRDGLRETVAFFRERRVSS